MYDDNELIIVTKHLLALLKSSIFIRLRLRLRWIKMYTYKYTIRVHFFLFSSLTSSEIHMPSI